MLRYHPSLVFDEDGNQIEASLTRAQSQPTVSGGLSSSGSSLFTKYRKKFVFLNYLWKHSLTVSDVVLTQQPNLHVLGRISQRPSNISVSTPRNTIKSRN